LAPIALLLGRHWRTIGTATLTAMALGAASLAAFGLEAWLIFFENLDWISQKLAGSYNVLAVIASPFSAMRLAGAGLQASYAVHLGLAVATGLVVAWVWWRPFATDLKVACLITGTTLMSPFHHDYDLIILAVPFAILVRRAISEEWLKGEPEGLFFVWLFPGIATVLAVNTGVQTGFVAPLVMLVLCLRRALRSAGTSAPHH
jgi:hypothetical protein